MKNQRRRLLALALVLCMLLPLFATVNAAETEPVADTPAAEAPETAVPATEMPASTSLEPIEAEQQVSLSDDGICIIKGESKSLIPEPEVNRGDAALGTAGSANPLTAAGVVWTSSDPTVATVDNTGTVTAHELGEATIRATLNGRELETYTVYSILADGMYVIQAFSSLHMLCPNEISMVNNTGMHALSQMVIGSDDAGFREEIGYRWYIDHQANGYYTIHPAHSRGMALYLLGGTTPSLHQEVDTTSTLSQWKIVSGSYGYVFQNREVPTVTFKFSGSSSGAYDSDIDDSAVVAVTYSTTDRYQSWDIYSAMRPSGMLLYDTFSGKLVADTWGACVDTFTFYAPKGITSNLIDEGIYLQILTYSGDTPPFTMSGFSPYADYNQSTGTITGNSIGDTDITISCTIDGNLVSIEFSLGIREQYTVAVHYDNAYSARYSSATWRVNQHTDAAFSILRQVGCLIAFQTPTLKESYGDMCDNSAYSSTCSHGENSDCTDACAPFSAEVEAYLPNGLRHHKNAYNVAYSMLNFDASMTLAYTGHNVCGKTSSIFSNGSTSTHFVNGEGGVTFVHGLALIQQGHAQVFSHESLARATSATVHELGHLFGAPDHYTNAINGWNIDDLDNLVDGDDPFSQYCIYGDKKNTASVISNITICKGCQMVLSGEIELP